MRERGGYWIGGTLAASLGVALVRLVAPELAGAYGSVTAAAGYVLVIAGITILARATGRRASQAFIARDGDARD